MRIGIKSGIELCLVTSLDFVYEPRMDEEEVVKGGKLYLVPKSVLTRVVIVRGAISFGSRSALVVIVHSSLN